MRCHIGLGGNVGEVGRTFRQALELLDRAPKVSLLAVSGLYRTSPIGSRAGGTFLNAAAELDVALPPTELLELMQATENRLGRTRGVRWGPRTIDLDLLLCGDLVLDQPRLKVPHPACRYRRFVLDPLVEIAASARHPESGLTIRQTRERLLARPLTVAVVGGGAEARQQVTEMLRNRFTADTVATSCSCDVEAAALPVFVLWLGPEGNAFTPGCGFEQLPAASRISLGALGGSMADAAAAVAEAALDEPVRVGEADAIGDAMSNE